MENIQTRILENSYPEPNSGCWLWLLALDKYGYGRITISQPTKKNREAHRVSYETFVGAIPSGLVIDHLCRNRLCVNPAHLEAVSRRENTLRSPIAIAALNIRKTHCKNGHLLSDENLYTAPWHVDERVSCRGCRECIRQNSRRYKARRRMKGKPE
jgi:hypothetical protein